MGHSHWQIDMTGDKSSHVYKGTFYFICNHLNMGNRLEKRKWNIAKQWLKKGLNGGIYFKEIKHGKRGKRGRRKLLCRIVQEE